MKGVEEYLAILSCPGTGHFLGSANYYFFFFFLISYYAYFDSVEE